MTKESALKNQARLRNFVLYSLTIAILLWLWSQNRTVSLQYLDQKGITRTLSLTVKERKRLTGLMQRLFAEDNFAYTILGHKPVSWATYLSPLPLFNRKQLFDSFSEYHRTIRSGWKVWKKYQHLFPSVYLISESSKCHLGWTSILLINKDNFNDIVNKNKTDFQEVLGREIVDGFQLIREAKNSSLMDEILQRHQDLIGTVLGYGRDNSWLFLEGCKNRVPIGCVWGTDYYLLHFSCPSFAGDPNSTESLALKSEYILTKQKIMEYYKDKDFLEATLSLLAGYQP